jgi:hypothetical protein
MNPLGLQSHKNIELQRGDGTSAGLFARSHAIFHFILSGNFDRNSKNSEEQARRLRPRVLSVVGGECFAQTSAFSCGRYLGHAGQNYHIAFA